VAVELGEAKVDCRQVIESLYADGIEHEKSQNSGHVNLYVGGQDLPGQSPAKRRSKEEVGVGQLCCVTHGVALNDAAAHGMCREDDPTLGLELFNGLEHIGNVLDVLIDVVEIPACAGGTAVATVVVGEDLHTGGFTNQANAIVELTAVATGTVEKEDGMRRFGGIPGPVKVQAVSRGEFEGL
jgi:hypothetical protein